MYFEALLKKDAVLRGFFIVMYFFKTTPFAE